jgi:uncharacterized YccA/Bax inhibitor family protein
MNIGRSANPVLNKKTFTSFTSTQEEAETMTIHGTVNKTAISLLLVLVGASYTWKMFFDVSDVSYGPATVMPWMIGGAIGGFVVALITVFNKRWVRITVPVYALLEGLFLGGLSATFEAQYPGIVMQAVALTFGVLFALLFAYKSGLIKATENFKLGVVAATGGVFIAYFFSFILGLFGVNIGFIHSNGPLGIGISIVIIIIAALNLVLDFDFIEKGSEMGAPKYMEWYGAFGLLVTLIWLYIEILRLLAKLASRRN